MQGWTDPRGMYGSTKHTEYSVVPMDGWKFWRWRVVQWSNFVMNPNPTTVSDNLTKKQAEGLVKLLEGVRDEQ